jgi:metallo-beta-lactamase family protein
MKLTFWGAAQTVTGSMHEVAVNGNRYLFDCGQYQGRRQEAKERNSNFPFRVASIHALMLSHAHIDHSGNLPLLVRKGYQGPIYTSAATADLCVPMLADSAHLQEMDAMFLNKRRQRRRLVDQSSALEEIQPLYTTVDAENVYPLFRPIPMHTPTEIGPGVSYSTVDAGHMLGSTSIVVEAKDGNRTHRLGYSGDVGRPGLPIIRDPEPLQQIDYLIMESTYGDRLHQHLGSVKQKLADVVNRTAGRGGKIIVPAFAVGRTQQLVLVLHELINEGKIPSIPIFVDSPLAVNVTEVFRKHEDLFDTETQVFLENGEDPFGFKRLRYIRDVNESKALNDLRGPFMVISASGMCEAGRILHHLRNNVEDPRNTILITGFQAENTLGRKIVDKQPEVNIFGEPYRLRAEVAKLNELSGHADQHELLAWMKPAVGAGLKRVFLVHGEPGQQRPLAQAIQETHGVEVTIPAHGDSFVLD